MILKIILYIKSTYQWHGFQVLELDVGDSFEPPGLVAHDELGVSHLPYAGHKILEVPGPTSGAQLHAKDGPSVTLLWSKGHVGTGAPDIPDMELGVDIAVVPNGREGAFVGS